MRLNEITIKGFKSIDRDGQTISFGDVTVLLGANGAGKSNLLSFFDMLNNMTTANLQNYVAKHGASRLLFYGAKETESISFSLGLSEHGSKSRYEVKLSHGMPDRLFISGEKIFFHREGFSNPKEDFISNDKDEIGLFSSKDKTSEIIGYCMSRVRAYHFDDTSNTAKVKEGGYVDDARYLRSNGGNLAAFLKMMKESDSYSKYYERIVRHIRAVMPQFGDFELETIPQRKNYVRLNWNDSRGSNYLFDPGQISDGSLRFMMLAALLLQPPELLPKFIVLDEPELGLHPVAICELAGMIKTASVHAQVLISTQSSRFVDEFNPEQIVIAEYSREKNSSAFRRLAPEELKEWLEQYSLSELWEKNILGGQP